MYSQHRLQSQYRFAPARGAQSRGTNEASFLSEWGDRVGRPAAARVDALVERAGKGLMARDRRPKPSAWVVSAFGHREPQRGAACAQLRGSGEHDGAARVRVRSVRASQRVGDDACGRRGRGRGTPQDVLCDEVLATRPLKHGGSGSRALITHVSRSSVHLSNLLTYLLYTYGTPDWRDLGFLVEAQISCVSTWLVVVSSTRG